MKNLISSIQNFFLAAFTFLVLATASLAQSEFELLQDRLDQQSQSLDSISQSLSSPDADPSVYQSLREVLHERRAELQAISNEISPLQAQAQTQLDGLGPAPDPNAENPVEEPDNIKALRKTLGERALAIEGLQTETGLLLTNVSSLLDRIADLRRREFIDGLFQSTDGINEATLWSNARDALRGLAQRAANALNAIDLRLLVYGFATIILFGILFLITTIRSAQKLRDETLEGLNEKLNIVSRSMMRPMSVFAVFGLIATLVVFYSTGQMPENDSLFFILFGLIGLIVFAQVALRRFSMLGLIGGMAEVVMLAMVLIFAIDAAVFAAGQKFGAQLELVVVQSYLSTGLIAFLSLILATKHWVHPEGRLMDIPRNRFAMMFFLVFGLGIITINLFGYPALARFVVRVVILLSYLLFFLYLVRNWAHGVTAQLALKLRNGDAPEEAQSNFTSFWLAVLVDIAVFIIAMPWALRIIGVDWADIQDWSYQAFFGFQIGNVNISIVGVLVGLSLFLGLLVATRVFQRVLANRILTKTRLTSSVRQSIVQVLGYVGLALALLVGVASIGFDLTNIALIAGALSVGIGFGLQSIVSNFVSGLILLFERPIKTGDWVETSAGQGFVKKVSVRATEIETFDRNSIIVPNSELISNSVKNWTHNNNTGRIVIRIGVSYDADPHQVKEILEKVGQDFEPAMKYPGPSVVFRDFGDNALIFDLRIFVKDILMGYLYETELRLAMWDALKAAGIEISYPQRDIHIRTAPGIESILAPTAKSKQSKSK